MKNFTKHLLTVLLAFCAMGAYAQYSPDYQRTVTVTEPFGNALTDYPALIITDTQTPIAAGHMQANGADIRFVDDCAFAQQYDYWIESGINTTATRIWVRIPSLAANATLNLNMTYGDPSAAAASSFSAAFPNAVITSGAITLTGTQQPGWLHVQAGDTLYVTGGASLTIIAGYVKIDGVIMAQGRGYTAPSLSSVGNGPGGGSFSLNSGSGGGSYAGIGGTGGQDAGDTPGTGGATYGTQTGTDLDMGSAGGSSDNTMGGNGGGAVTIMAAHIYVTGTINADGNDGVLPGGSRGGGGGAGGGILLMGDSIVMSGTLSANGGDGSIGTNTANDSGGGGGGGRTKMFSDAGSSNTGTSSANGGTGGPYGSTPGQNGGAGTTHAGTWAFAEPTTGAQIDISVSYTEANNDLCIDASPVTLTPATPAGGSYSGPGVSGNMFDPSAAGAGMHTITYSYTDGIGCTRTGTSTIAVNALPSVSYTEATATTCISTTAFMLTPGTPAGGTYSGPGVTGNIFDPAAAGTGAHDIIYSYTDGSGCISSDTSQVTVNALPVVTYVETAGTVCVDNPSFSLAAGSPAGGTYSGTGVTGSMFDPAAAGAGTHDIVYTYIDGANCMNADTSQITVDACTGIAAIEAARLNIYPNPANDNIVIVVSLNAGSNVHVSIFNALGSIVAQHAIESNSTKMDVSTLSAGVYTVSLYNGDQAVKHEKLVIRK